MKKITPRLKMTFLKRQWNHNGHPRTPNTLKPHTHSHAETGQTQTTFFDTGMFYKGVARRPFPPNIWNHICTTKCSLEADWSFTECYRTSEPSSWPGPQWVLKSINNNNNNLQAGVQLVLWASCRDREAGGGNHDGIQILPLKPFQL